MRRKRIPATEPVISSEILAKAITAIGGVTLSTVQFAVDPYSEDGDEAPLRQILVNILMRWGQEVTLTLWKIYMVHCQTVENNLSAQFSDKMIMTEVEKRFLMRIEEELVRESALAVAEIAEAATTPLLSDEG